jgi:hypothetical protein
MMPVLWFALGVALQVAILIRGDWRWGELGMCIAVSVLCGMGQFKDLEHYDVHNHSLMTLGLFAFLFASYFKRDVLPVITEKVLLSYTLVFWFAFLSMFFDGSEGHRNLGAIALIPTGLTAFIAIAKPRLGFGLKLMLYAWFLCIVVSVGLMQFPFRHLDIFLAPSDSPWLTPVDCIVAGMAFLFLAVNVSYLYELVPIPGKSQSWASRLAEWHELTDLMTRRVDDAGPGYGQAALILVGQGGVLLLAYLYHWLPGGLVINAFLVLPSLLYFGQTVARAIHRGVPVADRDARPAAAPGAASGAPHGGAQSAGDAQRSHEMHRTPSDGDHDA